MYIHLLTSAAWRERKIDHICLHPGEVLTTQSTLRDDLLISRQEVRTTLEKLEKSGAIQIVHRNKFGTVIKVSNFKASEVFSDYEATNRQPQKNHTQTNPNIYSVNNSESKNNKYKNNKKNNIIKNNFNNYNYSSTKEEHSDRKTGKPFKENGHRCGLHL
jgi:DNA-binding transcriptional MocR family regulator